MKNDKLIRKEIRGEIREYINEIDSIEDLREICDIAKDKSCKTLEEYVNKYYLYYNADVRKAFILEVRKIWAAIKKDIEKINPEEIDYYCEIKIEGYELDIWIDYIDCIFNPKNLAYIIFKIFKGEIFL